MRVLFHRLLKLRSQKLSLSLLALHPVLILGVVSSGLETCKFHESAVRFEVGACPLVERFEPAEGLRVLGLDFFVHYKN